MELLGTVRTIVKVLQENYAPLVVPLAIAFLPVFYVFPDANVTVREVLPGVVLTALGWAALQGASSSTRARRRSTRCTAFSVPS